MILLRLWRKRLTRKQRSAQNQNKLRNTSEQQLSAEAKPLKSHPRHVASQSETPPLEKAQSLVSMKNLPKPTPQADPKFVAIALKEARKHLLVPDGSRHSYSEQGDVIIITFLLPPAVEGRPQRPGPDYFARVRMTKQGQVLEVLGSP
jgi:hypothetical protein